MIATIERSMTLTKYKYRIPYDGRLSGIAYCNYGILPRRLVLTDHNGDTLYTLKQTNILWALFQAPLKLLGLFQPYRLYLDGKQVGTAKHTVIPLAETISENNLLFFRRPGCYTITSGNTVYEMRLHGNNYISVMKNGVQAALFQKNPWSENERNVYSAEYDENNIARDFVFLLCMLADISYFPNRGEFATSRYEKTINFPHDKYIERTKWKSPIKNPQ